MENLFVEISWSSFLFRRTLVVDGNFHGDHLKMRNPEDDVGLTDGQGYMVGDEKYQKHIAESVEMKQVSVL